MKTKFLKIEQRKANTEELNKILNEEISRIESLGNIIFDVKIAVGRDVEEKEKKIDKKYSLTVLIIYEKEEEAGPRKVIRRKIIG